MTQNNLTTNSLTTWRAPENNKHPIAEKLVDAFAGQTRVLEIGSGTGQHAVHFAPMMPQLVWQPSDRAENLEMISQRLAVEGSENILPPIELDVIAKNWPMTKFDAVFSANCIHIMGWDAVVAMFEGLERVLDGNARVALYGPFKYGGKFTTPSNADFDLWLRGRDVVSGIRDFEAVDELARGIGLACVADYAMPANNQLILWE